MHEARLTWVYKCESEKSVTPTCARSPFLSVGSQQARRLMNDQVIASNGNLESSCMGIDEA
jgi:hypothetical protein